MLHKHCNLNKWEIWNYTLPQVSGLIKSTNRYIRFEVETRVSPLSMFGGGVAEDSGEVKTDEDGNEYEGDYQVATSDDLDTLARILGG